MFGCSLPTSLILIASILSNSGNCGAWTCYKPSLKIQLVVIVVMVVRVVMVVIVVMVFMFIPDWKKTVYV